MFVLKSFGIYMIYNNFIYILLIAIISLFRVILQRHKFSFFLITFLCIFLVMALRGPSVGIDLETFYYVNFPRFANAPWDSLNSVVWGGKWEYGFCIFCKILSYISTDPQFFTIVTSLIISFSICFFLYRNSKNFYISIIVFILFSSFYMSMNIIRQYLAFSVVLFGIDYLLRKNKFLIPLLLFIFAAQFHISAYISIIYLIIYKLKIVKPSFILIIISLIVPLIVKPLVSFALTLPFLSEYRFYLSSEHFTGFFTVNSILQFLLPCIILFLFYFNIYKNNPSIYNKFIFFSLVFCTMFKEFGFTMNVMSRLGIFMEPMLFISIPIIEVRLKRSGFGYLIIIFLFLILIAYFLFITFFRGEMLFGIDYKFFWS